MTQKVQDTSNSSNGTGCKSQGLKDLGVPAATQVACTSSRLSGLDGMKVAPFFSQKWFETIGGIGI